MSRRRAGDQPEATDLDDVAFIRRAMLEGVATACRRDDLGAPGGLQLERARQVVVCGRGVPTTWVSRHPLASSDGCHPPRVTRRIDHDRLAVRGEQVGRVAQARREDDLEIRRYPPW